MKFHQSTAELFVPDGIQPEKALRRTTHVATTLRVIEARRCLPAAQRPEKLYGCEVWRSPDWPVDDDKVPFDLSSRENLQVALSGVYDSQICGGKRYDLASMGRRTAKATDLETHGLDTTQGLSFGMDLTPPFRTIQSRSQAFWRNTWPGLRKMWSIV